MTPNSTGEKLIPPNAPAPPMRTWIQKTAGVCGGQACVRHTRIAVWMLVEARQLGISDSVLRERYSPPLTQKDLDAAWDYDHHHQEEIDTAIRKNEDP